MGKVKILSINFKQGFIFNCNERHMKSVANIVAKESSRQITIVVHNSFMELELHRNRQIV